VRVSKRGARAEKIVVKIIVKAKSRQMNPSFKRIYQPNIPYLSLVRVVYRITRPSQQTVVWG
jgi:hypothetical protein